MGCGSSCGCGSSSGKSGCSKLDVYDWLQEMEAPKDGFDAIEVKFKGGRKVFYRNVNNLNIITGDPVVVESSPGHDIGYASATGEIVRLQMRKYKVEYNDDLKIIYRIATQRDMEKYKESTNRELSALYKTRTIVKELNLQMKMADIEFQGDNSKATFYYSADERVDFRELIKRLASEFKVRVEMRQISLRQEAGRIGGIGSCGRELCCSTWLTDFKNVGTSAARYQNLSLNPSKLSGQCGRLKCCLNYELDTYMDALKHIPKVKTLKTEKGDARLQKTDIFKQQMWFSFEGDSNWHTISASRAKEIQEMNKNDKIPFSLDLNEDVEVIPSDEPLNSDISQLDKKYKKKNHKRKPKSRKPQNRDQQPKQQPKQKQQGQQGQNQPNNKKGGNKNKQQRSQKPKPKQGQQANQENSSATPPTQAKGPKQSKFKKRRPPKRNENNNQ